MDIALIGSDIGDAVETPAGQGKMAGWVDRNGACMALVDLGERMPGDVVVVGAFYGADVAPVDGAMESTAQEGAMES